MRLQPQVRIATLFLFLPAVFNSRVYTVSGTASIASHAVPGPVPCGLHSMVHIPIQRRTFKAHKPRVLCAYSC